MHLFLSPLDSPRGKTLRITDAQPLGRSLDWRVPRPRGLLQHAQAMPPGPRTAMRPGCCS